MKSRPSVSGEGKFVGRQNEIRKIKTCIENFDFKTPFVFNLYGMGGIGKTRLTRKIYEDLASKTRETAVRRKNGAVRNYIYVNVSGCNTIPSLLFRLRMKLGSKQYDFEKFDTMYMLYYDAFAFAREKEFRTAEKTMIIREKKPNGGFIIDKDQLGNMKGLGLWLIDFVKEYFEDFCEENNQDDNIFIKAYPIVARIPLLKIIEALYKIKKYNDKVNQYVELLEEIDRNSGILQQERTLMRYFIDALQKTKDKNKEIFFIDNFQNENRFQNQGLVLEILHNYPAFWLVSTRSELPGEVVTEKSKIEGLEKEAASERILQSALDKIPYAGEDVNILKRYIPNFEKIERNILTASQVESENPEKGVLPLYLNAMCLALERQIVDAPKHEEDGIVVYDIDPGQFAQLNAKLDEAYYFEMGHTEMELDCFHTLSCKDIWDKYSLAVIRQKLGLYLLNTKHILAVSSMTESVSEDEVKLHEKIKELLYNSPNNRMKYDVVEIMHDAFLDIQSKEPIVNAALLESFFEFTRQFCDFMLKGNYTYRSKGVLEEFILFYEAFKKSIEQLRYSAGVMPFAAVFEKVSDYYVRLVEEIPGISDDKKKKAYESYYDLGLFLYNMGNTKKAKGIDERYLEHVQKLEDSFSRAQALNSVAVDYSGNHLYDKAYLFGNKALSVARGGLEKYLCEHPEDGVVKELFELYKEYFAIRENPEILSDEQVDWVIERMTPGLKDVSSIEKTSSRYTAKELFEQIFKTRGNIPWYFLQDENARKEWSLYAVQFGEITYRLRKVFYGENARNTLQSYHNMGVYKMKCFAYGLEHMIDIPENDYLEQFHKVYEIFETAYNLRSEYLKCRMITPETQQEYYKSLETDEKDNSRKHKFSEIYPVEDIKEMFPEELYKADGLDNVKKKPEDETAEMKKQRKLLSCHMDALESRQYMSNAQYYLALLQEGEERERAFKKAIDIVDEVSIVRSMAQGLYFRKTLESIRYGAEYYYKKGEYQEALKRIKCVLANMEKDQGAEALYQEYNELSEEIEKAMNDEADAKSL